VCPGATNAAIPDCGHVNGPNVGTTGGKRTGPSDARTSTSGFWRPHRAAKTSFAGDVLDKRTTTGNSSSLKCPPLALATTKVIRAPCVKPLATSCPPLLPPAVAGAGVTSRASAAATGHTSRPPPRCNLRIFTLLSAIAICLEKRNLRSNYLL